MHFLEDEIGNLFAGSRVVVTGATGFIGKHLCHALTDLGAEVHGLARTASDYTLAKGCKPWSIDLNEADEVEKVISYIRPNFIYHLAGLVTAQQEATFVLPTLQNNLQATVHLLLSAIKVECCRFVFVSSSEESIPGMPSSIPTSPYAAAKAAATLYARMFHQLYGLPVVLIRPFLVYGPGQEEFKLIPYTILSLLRGESPHLSSGKRICDFVYVTDVVRGILKATTHPELVGKSVELGTGKGTSIQEVVKLIAELTNCSVKPLFGALPDRKGELTHVAAREDTKKLFGWEAIWSLRDGLAKTIKWYQARVEKREVHG